MIHAVETDAVLFLKDRGCPVARLHGDDMRFFDQVHNLSGKRISIHEQMQANVNEGILRNKFISKFGFAVLDRHTVDLILRYTPIIEVGSGSGYWAHEIKKAGGDIIATDPGTGKYFLDGYGHRLKHWNHKFTDIEQLTGVEAVRKYRRRTLLTVWPDPGVAWPHETLLAFTGDLVLHVGEVNGRTGSEEFRELLEEKFTCENTVSIPQFFGLHDRLEIWRR